MNVPFQEEKTNSQYIKQDLILKHICTMVDIVPLLQLNLQWHSLQAFETKIGTGW